MVSNSLLGRFPEKYGIEIFQEKTYDTMLAWNKQSSINNYQPDLNNLGNTHFHVLKFNEINGRSHEIIEKETHMKFMRMFNFMLEFPGFTEMKKIKNRIRSNG